MTDKIRKLIKLEKIEHAKKCLAVYISEQHRKTWMEKVKKEYFDLWPDYREPTDKEKQEQYDEFVELAKEKGYTVVSFEEFIPDKIRLIWKTKGSRDECPRLTEIKVDPNYKTFDEWLNEERIIKEPVIDENGYIVKPGLKELIRVYKPMSYRRQQQEAEKWIINSDEYKEFVKRKKEEK
jgi:hypothetical protein